jgi:hypothetical protein
MHGELRKGDVEEISPEHPKRNEEDVPSCLAKKTEIEDNTW